METKNETDSAAARLLLDVAVDLDDLDASMRRIKIQVHTSARENSIAEPPTCSSS